MTTTKLLFLSAFSSGISSAYDECNCGRIHFDFNQQYDEEINASIAEYVKLHSSNPSQFQGHDGSIEGINISGCTYIDGCSCRKVEDLWMLINNNQRAIADYLNNKSEVMETMAKSIKCKS